MKAREPTKTRKLTESKGMNLLPKMKKYLWVKNATNSVSYVCVMDILKKMKDDIVEWGL